MENNATIGGFRDSRGEWRPERPISYAPVFTWPPVMKKFFLWLFYYLFTWNLVYLAIVILIYYFLQPPLKEMRTSNISWISTIFLRNMALVWLIFGGWHLYRINLKPEELKQSIVPGGKARMVLPSFGMTRFMTMFFGPAQLVFLCGPHMKSLLSGCTPTTRFPIWTFRNTRFILFCSFCSFRSGENFTSI